MILNKIGKVSSDFKLMLIIVLVAFMANMVWPQPIFAAMNNEDGEQSILKEQAVDLFTQMIDQYEQAKNEPKVARTVKVVATAYSSTPDQTDSTPCITANGFNVCRHGQENVIAANFLKFGTKVRIPELYGDKIFTVQDRMHSRFSQRIDLWKLSRQRALDFGKQRIEIEILAMK